MFIFEVLAMEKSSYKIYIIGAGVSGLTAAFVLEQHGYSPVLLEASDRIGGRLKTDIVEGYQLDHGFQVMLDAYPMVNKHLDKDALELQQLKPGAIIFSDHGTSKLGDPLRDASFFWSTISSDVGSLGDKLKVFNLNKQLRKKSLDAIFNEPEMSTLEYLQNYGFSNTIIDRFFKPFFSGIFLEDQLATSSRMFEFVYKMFGMGLAVIPKDGIKAIPAQLRDRLKTTEIKYNSKVSQVQEQKIILDNGEEIETHFTLVATAPQGMISGLKDALEWRSCDCLYFECSTREIKEPIIGLAAASDSLINNIFYPSSISTGTSGGAELLSVTVVKQHDLNAQDLIQQVIRELNEHFGIAVLKHLKTYQIPKALPKLIQLEHHQDPTETKLTNSIFIAGDHQLNASLNAAMSSGESAALGIIETLESGLRVGALTSEYR